MARRQPISKAEQQRRFDEAAREAGVATSDEALEHIVRQIAKPRQGTIQVTGISEVSARKKLAAWKRHNPKAKIISEEVKSATHPPGHGARQPPFSSSSNTSNNFRWARLLPKERAPRSGVAMRRP